MTCLFVAHWGTTGVIVKLLFTSSTRTTKTDLKNRYSKMSLVWNRIRIEQKSDFELYNMVFGHTIIASNLLKGYSIYMLHAVSVSE